MKYLCNTQCASSDCFCKQETKEQFGNMYLEMLNYIVIVLIAVVCFIGLVYWN